MNLFIHHFVRAAALLFVGAVVPVQVHASMPMHMGSELALGASAAFAPDGRLWVVDAHDDHVWLRHSDDFGEHFSQPTPVNAVAEKISAEGENRPKIAMGSKGEIYVSWTQPRPKPYTGFIRFARSLDGGAHFQSPITVHHDRAEITHRFDALAVDGKGRVLVAWIDKRDLERAKTLEQPYLGAAVYYAWSDDGGASFAPEQKLADPSCECCRIALANTPDGHLAMLWRAVYGDNIRDHAYAVLRHGVKPRAQRATYTQWHIEGCPHQGPGLAVGADGRAHAVWFSASGDAPTIWYGQLDPGHPPRHRFKVAGAGAAHADVRVHGQEVTVVWNQLAPKGTQLMARRSHDGGVTFGKPQMLAQANGGVGSPQLLRFKSRRFVAWNGADGFRLVAVEDKP